MDPMNDPKIKNKLDICKQDFEKLWNEMMERRNVAKMTYETQEVTRKLAIGRREYDMIKRMLKTKILHKLRLGNDKYFTTFMKKGDEMMAYDPEFPEGRAVLSGDDVNVVSMSDTDKVMSPKMLLLSLLREGDFNEDIQVESACAMWDIIKEKKNMIHMACLLYSMIRTCRELWGVQVCVMLDKTHNKPKVMLAVPKTMDKNDMMMCGTMVEGLQGMLMSNVD